MGADEQIAAAEDRNAERNAAAREQGDESTLMTKSLGDEQGDADGEGRNTEKGGDEDADKSREDGKEGNGDTAPDKPEGYILRFAEGMQVDAELLSGFRKTAHELGMSQDTAQKLASLYEANAARARERAAHAQQKALDDAKARWEGEISKRPDFVQEREHIRVALRQYGDQELYDLINQTNLGSHPKMWAFMAKIGKELAEPGFYGKNSGKDKSAADVLYPNQGR